MSGFDIVGIGLNATDTLLMVPQYPPYAGKVRYQEEHVSTGGEAATAMVACARLGLRAAYVGSVGDDWRGEVQLESLRSTGVNIDHVQHKKDCPNQSAHIVIDQTTGERTVFARWLDCLAIDPALIPAELIRGARMLHMDGHNVAAALYAAGIARETGVPVSVDVDTVYPGFEKVLPLVDYLVASSDFPCAWTGLKDPLEALKAIQQEYGMRVAVMTQGAEGSLALEGGRFMQSPGFSVNCVDTTGAGDVFHGAFCYGVLQGLSTLETLEFANAMAALNCTKLGARGGIVGLDAVKALVSFGARTL